MGTNIPVCTRYEYRHTTAEYYFSYIVRELDSVTGTSTSVQPEGNEVPVPGYLVVVTDTNRQGDEVQVI